MGANWQTTLSGVGAALGFGLTTLAGLSYSFGDIAMFFFEVKKWVAITSAIATVILKIWNLAQKSRNVVGGNTQQTLDGDLAKPGTQTLVDQNQSLQTSLSMKTLIALVSVMFTSCASITSPPGIASTLAQDAVVAVAKHYGGDKAGELASAGLPAPAEVLQGYVNHEPPLRGQAASPGVTGLGKIVVDYLKASGYVSQDLVNKTIRRRP